MRFAAVARVTDKNWVACAVDDSIDFGLKPGGELVLESTICHEIRQHQQPVIFGQASTHPVFSLHHTPKTYGLESYISIPIVKANGEFFGTLCAIDSVPANLDEPAIAKTLTLFAQLIAMNLDTQKPLEATKVELNNANELGRLREQFIAVLGHDLRTPLSAIRMSADLLETRTEDKRSLNLIAAIRNSSMRMGVLIENILDFARGRLGGGIPVQRVLVDDLQQTLQQTLAEVQASHPLAIFESTLNVPAGVHCDALAHQSVAVEPARQRRDARFDRHADRPQGLCGERRDRDLADQSGAADSRRPDAAAVRTVFAIRSRATRRRPRIGAVYRVADCHGAQRDVAGQLDARRREPASWRDSRRASSGPEPPSALTPSGGAWSESPHQNQ